MKLTSIKGGLVGAVLFLVFLAWAAHQIYLWLMPIVPNLIGLAIVIGLLSLATRSRRG